MELPWPPPTFAHQTPDAEQKPAGIERRRRLVPRLVASQTGDHDVGAGVGTAVAARDQVLCGGSAPSDLTLGQAATGGKRLGLMLPGMAAAIVAAAALVLPGSTTTFNELVRHDVSP